jgi:hypothetical protein
VVCGSGVPVSGAFDEEVKTGSAVRRSGFLLFGFADALRQSPESTKPAASHG